MSHHRTRKRRTATAVVTLVSCLSLFAVAAQSQTKPKPRAGQATASLQDDNRPNPNAQGGRRTDEPSTQSDGQDASDLKEIADGLARIDKGLKQKGQPGINVANVATDLSDENALRVVEPVLRDINGQLNAVDTSNQQYRPIQPQDTRRNLASIKAQLATYETRLQRALTNSSASTSQTTAATTQTPESGWGDSLSWLGQVALAALSLLGLGLGAAALLLFL
ncbi:MAG TPA: hypothetical protein VER32_01580, partial [Pyrinomonadaceae bacterium]|nr:hypothetical protein [Pyrinomonadaceae bacterium]